MEKVIISEAPSKWAMIDRDIDEVQIWIKPLPHKGREFSSRVREIITLEEWNGRIKAMAQAQLDREKEEVIKVASTNDRVRWIASLPNEINDLFINKDEETIEDEFGNFLFPLPSKPVSNFSKWVDGQMENMFCE